jgi:hypothetical protein
MVFYFYFLFQNFGGLGTFFFPQKFLCIVDIIFFRWKKYEHLIKGKVSKGGTCTLMGLT